MSRNETTLTDAEWDAKFNGPRNALLGEIFGNTPCPVSDISPVVHVIDKNWEARKSFMDQSYMRITDPLNANMEGIDEINSQISKNHGKIVTKMSSSKLNDLKEVPAPIK